MEQLTIWIPSRKIALIWAIALAVFLIILLIMAKKLSDSLKASAQNNGRINQYLAAVPAEQIGTISAVYQNTRKSLGHAMILTVLPFLDTCQPRRMFRSNLWRSSFLAHYQGTCSRLLTSEVRVPAPDE